MTGHQENPGSGFTLQGEATEIMDIATIAKSLGCKNIRTVNPNNLEEVRDAFKWAYSLSEASVIITRWPCVLKKLTKADKLEFDLTVNKNYVDKNECIGCRVCMKTGCPALRFDNKNKKASINEGQCMGCNICAQVCPKNAIKKVGK
jgi:indolepyruvate ferredoxin oxidoreductase alpha subunit